MSWASDKANEAFSGDSVTAGAMRRSLEQIIEETVEEAARRAWVASSHADRQEIVDAIEDMLVDDNTLQQPQRGGGR